MIAARGHVAITASVASFGHAPGMSAYSASKAGVEALANSLRTEVAHQGVTVATLHPSWIATDMVTEGDAESTPFQRLREAMRPPIDKTYPVASIVGPIVDGFAAPQPADLPARVRPPPIRDAQPAHSGPLLRDQLKAAPDMRQLFADQAEKEGARYTAFGPRWGH